MLVAFGAKATVEGTLATPGFVELRVTISPAPGAGADKFSVRFCVCAPFTVKLCGEKLTLAVTCTG